MTVDELTEYGLERMGPAAIDDCLATESVGVLGLPTDDVPYLLPLSYGYDPEVGSHGACYFAYLVGSESRKATLSERAGRARFLVYDVETTFRWRSVLATGTLARVPDDEVASVQGALGDAWRPNTLETATTAGGVDVYGLSIESVDGVEQTGLAPGFRENISP